MFNGDAATFSTFKIYSCHFGWVFFKTGEHQCIRTTCRDQKPRNLWHPKRLPSQSKESPFGWSRPHRRFGWFAGHWEDRKNSVHSFGFGAQGCRFLILMGELGLNCEGCCWMQPTCFIYHFTIPPLAELSESFLQPNYTPWSQIQRGFTHFFATHLKFNSKSPWKVTGPEKEAGLSSSRIIFQGRAVKLRGGRWLWIKLFGPSFRDPP